jgi:hypothetical protein
VKNPETRYAKTDDGAHIAYQVVRDGPLDLIFIPWWWNHLESQWDDPLISHFLDRLASFSPHPFRHVRHWPVGSSVAQRLADAGALDG